jgi:hypothetical protein
MWRECFACTDPEFVWQGLVYKVTLLSGFSSFFFKKKKEEKKSFVGRIEELIVGYSVKSIKIYI